jgi:predicted permease
VLSKSPGFTIVAVLTLALAIGANAVVFGVLNGLVLRPLNVPRAESLYGIEPSGSHSYPDYLDIRDRNRSFDGLAAYSVKFAAAALDTGETPPPSWLIAVSGNYFDVLGIKPYIGRYFHASDEHGPNSAPYIVLPYAYWHTHFHDDRNVVGRTVRINKHPFTIIGVTPPEFRGTFVFMTPDFYLPIVNGEQVDGTNGMNARGTASIFMAIGHLKTDITPAHAAADLNSIGSYLEKAYPKDHARTTYFLARPGLGFLGRPVAAFLGALMMLASLILLAACANLGSLFAARAADRAREVALRLALGSSRNRILLGHFTEALLISLLGGAAGLVGSVVLLHNLSVWQPFPNANFNVPVTPDAKVYAIALALALASAFLFALVPVRQAFRTDPYQVVKSGSLGMAGRRITVRDLLLGVQIAICAVLVTSSFVAVRGLMRSLNSNFGFEPRNAMLLDVDPAMAGYRGETVPALQKRMIDAMGRIPGVSSVGLVDWQPLKGGYVRTSPVFGGETTDLRTSNAVAQAARFSISPEYFRSARTALLSGRDFTWHDDNGAPRVAVVNQEFARKLFGSATNAMGGYYRLQDGTRVQVVGIVEDGKYKNLTEDPQPAMFLSILQWPSSAASLVLRSNRDPGQLQAAMRSTLRVLDSELLPSSIETWSEKLDVALFPSRVATVSLGVLGAMGAILSVTGIFGLAAYSVSKRKRELGIRMALGAQWREVLQAALGRAFKLLAFGSAAGLLLGVLAARVLASIVYQATPRDPLVLAGVVLVMSLLGLLATWVPAQRALSLDPSSLLREE